MFHKKRITLSSCNSVALGLYFLCFSLNVFSQQQPIEETTSFAGYPYLEKAFLHPRDAAQTGVYWYWMSGNISKEGVVKDLEAMKKAGINRAFIGNIQQDDVKQGSVAFMSEEWWDILHTALKTATRLNIEIGIFNSPGWSQSGGPWIKPAQSMRYLASTETRVSGGKEISIKLPKAAAQFQDVSVIAFPVPKDYHTTITAMHPVITGSASIKNLAAIMDGDSATEAAIRLDSVVTINVKTGSDFIVRSLVLYPSQRAAIAKIWVQVSSADSFKTIKEFTADRSNGALNVGFDPYGRVAIALPETSSNSFRIVISNLKTNYEKSWGPAPDSTIGIKELVLSSSPKVEQYIEKTLAKMSQTPFPLWGQYLWGEQAATTDKSLAIDPASVINITRYMTADGTLRWTPPSGEWMVVRSGMVPTGVVNSPAPPNGTGLEVDKINKKYLTGHFDGFLGKILERIPARDRTAFKMVVEDSYETGGQNWTDGLTEKFKAIYQYDPTPYIPVLYGSVVGSEEQSNRFLWDLRRFVADKVSFEYVGGLRDIAHKHGLKTWLENYGHWGFPGEFLQYGGQSDEIGGEFWSEGDLGNIENRAAASSAHIYGKTKVSAESFTCGGAAFSRCPAKMKQRGDRFFTEGINNTLMHVYIEQPYSDRLPGVNAGFGNEFNRNNTWFGNIDMFTDYLKRCNLMLQQGRYVADVAYFIGEDAPKMTGVCDPPLPKGYSFDYINADVLKQRISVRDGKLALPNGITYKLLVLPQLQTMRPELLLKISELVKQGAVVLGPAPQKSPSLQNYQQADHQVKKIANAMWQGIDGKTATVSHFGNGMVINGMALQEALQLVHAAPDCTIDGDDSVLFIHRKINADEVYFISNQKEKPISFTTNFKVTGKQPELWDAVTGQRRLLPDFTINKNTTSIPLQLPANGSAFIVFRSKAFQTTRTVSTTNFPAQKMLQAINTPWIVDFDTARWGPLQPQTFDTLTDWTKSANNAIKYYSGTAVYHNNFKMGAIHKGEHIVLNLGNLSAMATVKINGKAIGGVWTAPYQLDITHAVQQGDNTVEIVVVNTWVNRLIGDLNLPEKERKTWVSVNPYSATSPLEPAGLLGPVTIGSVAY